MSKIKLRKRIKTIEPGTELRDSKGYILRYNVVAEHELGSDFVASIFLRDPRAPDVLVHASVLHLTHDTR